MKKELDCIVVTDHNTFQWIPELRKALTEYQQNPDDDYRDIVIFPGIEITVPVFFFYADPRTQEDCYQSGLGYGCSRQEDY